MVIPAKQSTGIILPMLIVGDIFAVSYYHRHAVWSHLAKLLPCAIAGVVVGFLLLRVTKSPQLRPIIGATILAMLGMNFWRDLANKSVADVPSARPSVRTDACQISNGPSADSSVPHGWWFPVIMGLIAGTTTMMANAAGPIMIIYLLAMRLPKIEFVGTGAWFFLVINLLKVPFSASPELGLINANSLQFNLILSPLIVIGALAGVRLVKYVPQKTFTKWMQILAALGALQLLLGIGGTPEHHK
jgi:uncharacterized membrane protein YfcA